METQKEIKHTINYNELLKCDCGWKGTEKQLKNKQVDIIAHCPEFIEVCPKCGNEWLIFD